MKRVYASLPGPAPLRITLAFGLLMVALVALHFFYEWLGAVLLDTGGTIE